MKIYTKTGDAGTTGLYGGERVRKDAPRVSAYGTVDEANAAVGLARAHLTSDDAYLIKELKREVNEEFKRDVDADLETLQNALFDVGADLATPPDSPYRKNVVPIDEADIAHLEGLIDTYDAELPALQNFILPGGHPASAALQLARAVVRRAERETVGLSGETNPQVAVYLNRLSDLLFVLARVVNARSGESEVRWRVKGRERPEE